MVTPLPSRFDAALAPATRALLATVGEQCIFHDTTGQVSDMTLPLLFDERNIMEPPGNMGAFRGQYSLVWTTVASLPVVNPEGYQIIIDGIAYWIREASLIVGGVQMKLHKVRP